MVTKFPPRRFGYQATGQYRAFTHLLKWHWRAGKTVDQTDFKEEKRLIIRIIGDIQVAQYGIQNWVLAYHISVF